MFFNYYYICILASNPFNLVNNDIKKNVHEANKFNYNKIQQENVDFLYNNLYKEANALDDFNNKNAVSYKEFQTFTICGGELFSLSQIIYGKNKIQNKSNKYTFIDNKLYKISNKNTLDSYKFYKDTLFFLNKGVIIKIKENGEYKKYKLLQSIFINIEVENKINLKLIDENTKLFNNYKYCGKERDSLFFSRVNKTREFYAFLSDKNKKYFIKLNAKEPLSLDIIQKYNLNNNYNNSFNNNLNNNLKENNLKNNLEENNLNNKNCSRSNKFILKSKIEENLQYLRLKKYGSKYNLYLKNTKIDKIKEFNSIFITSKTIVNFIEKMNRNNYLCIETFFKTDGEIKAYAFKDFKIEKYEDDWTDYSTFKKYLIGICISCFISILFVMVFYMVIKIKNKKKNKSHINFK